MLQNQDNYVIQNQNQGFYEHDQNQGNTSLFPDQGNASSLPITAPMRYLAQIY